MNDYSELERLAEAAKIDPCSPYIPCRVAFDRAATPEVVLELIAENKAMAELKAHLTELREAHGFESWAAALVEVDRLRGQVGQYAAASMNVSGFGEAFYQVAERLGVTGARPVSPMQVFADEVLPALDKALKDAERYRFLRRTDSWGDIDFEDHGLWIVNSRDEVINQDGVKLDAAVDAAMSKEAGHDPA